MAQLSDDCFAFGGPLMTVAQAAALMAERLTPVAEPERVPLMQAAGRILAEDVVAPADIPPHDNSAVDGYAVHFDDLNPDRETRLPILPGRAAAGHPFAGTVPQGAALRVFTGAVMPPGPDTVMMQEDCAVEHAEAGATVVIRPGIARGANRRRAGEDVRAGTTVLRRGARLRPQDVGMAASLGRMAERWDDAGGTDEALWRRDAARQVAGIGCLQAVEWIDPDHVVRWIEPLAGNASALGLRLSDEARRRAALMQARAEDRPTFTGLVALRQGGIGFLLYAPLRTPGPAGGFLLAVVRADDFLGQLRRRTDAWDAQRDGVALVQDGDMIELDVPSRKLNLLVPDEELAKRRAAWQPPAPRYQRGYGALMARHVTQANKGCDFDFLEGTAPTPDPEIH